LIPGDWLSRERLYEESPYRRRRHGQRRKHFFPLASLAAAAAASSATSVNSAAKPVATIPQLADYLINGFWQFNSTIAHHWSTSTISYNISGLTAAETGGSASNTRVANRLQAR
jgi:hypothetical protein